jgi:hypothetical protein
MSEDGFFDLSVYSSAGYARVKSFRLLCGALLLTFTAILVAIAVVNLERGTLLPNFDHTFGVPYVGLGLTIGLCLWGVRVFGPGANRLTIDDTGVEFDYPSGLSTRLSWRGRNFRLNLWDWTPSASLLPESAIYEVGVRLRPRSNLPRIAFLTLLEEARAHGLTISDERPSTLLTSIPGELHRIRRAANTGS